MNQLSYQKRNRFIGFVLIAFFTVLIGFTTSAFAESDNIFVEDNANILSNEDKTAIKNMNEDDFANLPGKPQYVVVTLNNLDGYDSIEDYAEKKFQHLGIGNKELDNGFLFVISVEDRKYRLETGYGVEDVITDSMKDSVVPDEATDLLKDEKYGQAVMFISRNVQNLVNEKYGDVEAAKRLIEEEKARDKKIAMSVMFAFLAVVAIGLLVIMWYRLRIAKIRKMLTKDYLGTDLKGYIYIDKANQITGLGKGIKKVELPEYLAKQLNRLTNNKKEMLFSDRNEMIEWIAQYILVDGIIQYWRKAKKEAPYDVSVYLESKYLNSLKAELIPESKEFAYPVMSNPYLEGNYIGVISDYTAATTEKHQRALKISKDNKRFIEKMCEQFLSEKGVRLSRVNNDLQVALMVYYFLRSKDLSNPNLLQEITINTQELAKSYRFAEKKRKEIASDQKQKALDDLTNMTLGSYYMQSMIWSSYHSGGGSSGGGGGSSFGGGSSGGGGFSGGW